MRINWFSPLLPALTNIANYTNGILPCLSKEVDVVLWTDQDEWDKSVEEYAEVKQYNINNISWSEVNNADISFFNIGNSPNHHKTIWEISQLHPGIIVLHDTSLQHLFGSIYMDHYQEANKYCRLMERYYGKSGYETAVLYCRGKVDIEYIAKNYPLTDLALINAVGVVVHTEKAFNSLLEQNRYPLVHLQLPYMAQKRKISTDGNKSNVLNDKSVRLIVFGYIGPNRRLESILTALSRLSKKDCFRLDIYGKLWDEKHVLKLCESLDLNRLVKIHGFVEESELDGALSSAHLAVNLRNPSMGEASGAQLRIWDHALPSLVSDTGWYSSLPSDSVFFVRQENEVEDLQSHFMKFLENPDIFFKKGEVGRRILKEMHSPHTYCRGISQFASSCKKFISVPIIHDLSTRTYFELSNWNDGDLLNKEIRNIISHIIDLFD